jgi:hypothetical protein
MSTLRLVAVTVILALITSAATATTSAFDMDVAALATTLFPNGLVTMDTAAKHFTHHLATAVRSGVAPSWLPSDAVMQIGKIRLSLQVAGTLDDDAAVVDALLTNRKILQPTAALGDDPSSSYPYWGFVPKFLGVTMPSSKQYSGSTPCFASVNLSSTFSVEKKSVQFDMSFGRQRSALCSDHLMIGAPGVLLKFLHVDAETTLQWHRNVSTVASKAWLLENKGVNVFRFNKGWVGLILDVLPILKVLLGAKTFESHSIPHGEEREREDEVLKRSACSPAREHTSGADSWRPSLH